MRRMTLVNANAPPRPKPPVDPLVKAMDVLDTGMQSALTREDIPVEERMQQYDQALARYMHVHDEYRPQPIKASTHVPIAKSTPEDSTEPTDAIKDELMASVPPSMKRRAEQLWRRIKTSQYVDWNDRGELIYKGNTIKGSNVVDLVNDVLRKRKAFNPEGWEVFGDALREENVPQNLIGHDTRWQYIRSTPRQRKDSETFQTPMRTPTSTPRLPKQWAQYKGKSTIKRN